MPIMIMSGISIKINNDRKILPKVSIGTLNIASIENEQTMMEMCKQTKVVVSTVGP